MLSSLYLSLGFSGIRLATQKLNFSASDDEGLSPALATSSANLECLFPTAMALQKQRVAQREHTMQTPVQCCVPRSICAVVMP